MSAGWTREQMAARAALDIPDGAYVNLGIGIPELVAQFVPEGREFIYHTENGLLGMGPPPSEYERDLDLMNDGKKYVTAIPGAAYFHHAESVIGGVPVRATRLSYVGEAGWEITCRAADAVSVYRALAKQAELILGHCPLQPEQ